MCCCVTVCNGWWIKPLCCCVREREKNKRSLWTFLTSDNLNWTPKKNDSFLRNKQQKYQKSENIFHLTHMKTHIGSSEPDSDPVRNRIKKTPDKSSWWHLEPDRPGQLAPHFKQADCSECVDCCFTSFLEELLDSDFIYRKVTEHFFTFFLLHLVKW